MTFINPYPDDGTKPMSRINADVPSEVFNLIRSIRPYKGTIQTTFNLLLHKLINELNIRGINSIANVAQFEYFLTNCRLVGPATGTTNETTSGGSVGGTNPQANVGNDHRRTPSLDNRTTPPEVRPSIVQIGSGVKGPGKRKPKSS